MTIVREKGQAMTVSWRMVNPPEVFREIPGVSRTTPPLPSGDPPGMNRARGAAYARAVQAGVQMLQRGVVKSAINKKLDKIGDSKGHLLDEDGVVGLLAVAILWVGTAQTTSVQFKNVHFENAAGSLSSALKKYRNTGRIEPHPTGPGSKTIWGTRNPDPPVKIVRLFYWGTHEE